MGSEPLVLDIYIPSLKVAFDYNAYKHQHNLYYSPFSYIASSPTRKPDLTAERKKALNEVFPDVNVIDVHYWWYVKGSRSLLNQNRTGDELQLVATIRKFRPDLLESRKDDITTTRPISDTDPKAKSTRSSFLGTYTTQPITPVTETESPASE